MCMGVSVCVLTCVCMYVCVWEFSCMYVNAPHSHLMPEEVRRGHQTSRNWNRRHLLATMWVLGTEPRSFAGVLSALKYRDISVVLHLIFLKTIIIVCMCIMYVCECGPVHATVHVQGVEDNLRLHFLPSLPGLSHSGPACEQEITQVLTWLDVSVIAAYSRVS